MANFVEPPKGEVRKALRCPGLSGQIPLYAKTRLRGL
jgi:hypothetical protein